MRFRCPHKTGGCLTFSPERNVIIIVSTGILCKDCVKRSGPLLDDDDEDVVRDDTTIYNGRQIRAHLISTAFC